MPFIKKIAWPPVLLHVFVLLQLLIQPVSNAVPCSFAAPLSTEVRVALVVGVDQYDGDPLRLPVRDAELISRHLKQVGFDVMLVKNPTKGVLIEAIDQFVQKIRISGSNVTALFFFAGHAVQFDGHNYMIPVDAGLLTAANRSGNALPGKAAFVDRAVDAQLGILNYLNESGAKQVIFVLDACRTNPFEPERRGLGRTRGAKFDDGLAPMDAHPGGADTFILFAAAPTQAAFDGDKLARNSPFSQAFAHAISQPGSSLEMVFRKVNDQVRNATGGIQRPYQEGVLFSFTFKEALKTTEIRPEKSGMLNTGFTESDYNSANDGGDLLKRLLKTRTIEDIRKAAESGDAEAQYLLSIVYLQGHGVDIDYEEYAFWLRRAAIQGFTRAQFATGMRLYHGYGGTAPNIQEGIDWLRLAAQNGNASAMLWLGDLYRIGEELPQDLDRAESLFNQALATGNINSYVYIGGLYATKASIAKGAGNEPGYNQASQQRLDNYLIGSDRGCTPCKSQIATMYRYGQYVSRDIENAKSWYTKAIETDDRYSASAAEQLAYMYESEKEMGKPQYEEAAIYWRKAIDLGSTTAKYKLAHLVYNERITSTSAGEALMIFEELASGEEVNFESVMSTVILHVSYFDGNHLVKQDFKKAEELATQFLEMNKEVDPASSVGWPMRAVILAWNLIDIYNEKGITPSDPNLLAQLEFRYGSREKQRKLSLPFTCGSQVSNKQIYVWDWSRPESPTKAQFEWQESSNGCKISQEVEKQINTLYNRARANNESFSDLAWEEFGKGK